ncbi:SpaA isopeptide-forming pilin-related protein [Trueperella pyogenes]
MRIAKTGFLAKRIWAMIAVVMLTFAGLLSVSNYAQAATESVKFNPDVKVIAGNWQFTGNTQIAGELTSITLTSSAFGGKEVKENSAKNVVFVNGEAVAHNSTASPNFLSVSQSGIKVTLKPSRPITLPAGAQTKIQLTWKKSPSLHTVKKDVSVLAQVETPAPDPITQSTDSASEVKRSQPGTGLPSGAHDGTKQNTAKDGAQAPSPRDDVNNRNPDLTTSHGDSVYWVDTKCGTLKTNEPTFVRGSSPSVKASIAEEGSFEKAILRVEAPNSILAREAYQVNISQIEDGVSLQRRVVKISADYIEVEFYPVRDGVRLQSAVVPKGAEITASAQLSGSPTIKQFGLKLCGATKKALSAPVNTADFIVPGPGSPSTCGADPGIYWVSAKPQSGFLRLNDGKIYQGDYAVEFKDGKETGRVLQLAISASSDIAVSADNKTMYAVALDAKSGANLYVYDIETGKLTRNISVRLPAGESVKGFNSLSMAPGGKSLYLGALKYGVVEHSMPTSPSPVFEISLDEKGIPQPNNVRRIAQTSGNTNWGGDFITLPSGETLAAQMDGYLVMWPGKPEGTPMRVGKISGVEGRYASLGDHDDFKRADTGTYPMGLAYAGGSVIFVDDFLRNSAFYTRPATKPNNPKLTYEEVLKKVKGVSRLDEIPSLKNGAEKIYSSTIITHGFVRYPNATSEMRVKQNGNVANWGLTSPSESNPCPPSEQASFLVKKEAANQTASKISDDHYVADYVVTVANVSDKKGTSGQVLDHPVVPSGFEIIKVEIAENEVAPYRGNIDKLHIPLAKDKSYLISEGVELEASTQISYPVRVHLRPMKSITFTDWEKVSTCSDAKGGNVSPDGVPNLVSLAGEPQDAWDDNDACVTIPPSGLDVDLQVQKVDFKNKTLPLTGAEFTIYRADQNMKIDWNSGIIMTVPEGTSAFYSASLKTNTFYYLVETRAPNPVKQDSGERYQLLPEPILFQIYPDNDGYQQVQFYDSKKHAKIGGDALINVFQRNDEPSKTAVYIQVANVSTGTLPRTGGAGVAWLGGIGGLLVLAGLTWAQRKQRA